METRSLKLAVKAAGEPDGLAEGSITAYAAVFGNVDSYGDIIVKGAFSASLTGWKDSGNTIPLLWGHNMGDPMMNIGAVTKAEEDDRGLRIEATFDLDNPIAAQVYRLVKGRRVSDLSFAFDIVEHEIKDDVRRLNALELYECSIVPIGANPETEIVAVKSAVDALKAGRAISTANEKKLRDLQTDMKSGVALIDDVLSSNNGAEKGAEHAGGQSSGHAPPLGSASSSSKARFNPSDPLVENINLLTIMEVPE